MPNTRSLSRWLVPTCWRAEHWRSMFILSSTSRSSRLLWGQSASQYPELFVFLYTGFADGKVIWGSALGCDPSAVVNVAPFGADAKWRRMLRNLFLPLGMGVLSSAQQIRL